MPISFSMSPEQRALQLNARRFGERVLRTVDAATRKLPTPDARFSATRPMYEQAIAAGFLHRLIPMPFGGGGTGLMDMAVVAEEFYAVDVNVSLTLFANLLGLMPVFAAGTPEQQRHLVAPFLTKTGAPLAALANSEPGGSANFGSSAEGTGTRTHARLEGDEWVINGAKHWVSSATGWDGLGADLLTVVCRTDAMESSPAGLSVIAVNRGASGFRHTSSADSNVPG